MSVKMSIVLLAAVVFALDANAIIGRRGTTGSDMIATVNCHRYAKQSLAELIAEGAIS